ncbi:alpha/beta hydrolase [Rugosimonospora africana]|uniref:alpha/beta hydrolase n=1 Tax=Rugosimonospora africana TaxID=556532 RepID=UPI001940DA6A|nr:alpha/beta hydrolase [Rugosimonospora africana]
MSHDVAGYVPEPVSRVERASFSEVPARVYFPSHPPRAVVVYFHGGGFVAGNLDTHDKTTRRVANGAVAIVASVDYRLSPEHPFPLPFEDALTATREAARRYPHLPLLVMGDSAGGALAASVAQWARDSGLVEVVGQVLVYPVIDFDLESRSMLDYGSDYLLTRADLAMYRRYYLNGTDSERYALPGSMADLSGLPPAAIAIAGFDPLRDEGARYALRLAEAGVPVNLLDDAHLIHGWLEVAETIPAATSARGRLVEAVRDLSATSP